LVGGNHKTMTTTPDTKRAWADAGDHLTSLGLKLKFHFEQTGVERPATGELSAALEQLGTAIERTFSAIGNAVNDPAVRDDVSRAAESLAEALADTVSEAGQELAEAAKGLRCRPAG